MARTDKDAPYRVRAERGEVTRWIGGESYRDGNVFRVWGDDGSGSGDPGFRHARKWAKRHRAKAQRRAEFPTYRRTYDFE